MKESGVESGTCPNLDEKGHKDLDISEKEALEELYSTIGENMVSYSKISYAHAPAWLVEKVVQEGISSNWTNAYQEMPENSVPAAAAMISSHLVFKVKVEKHEKKRVRAGLSPHGNKGPS